MLNESNPLAAVFIGGMEGVREEFSRFAELYPERPTCAVSRPGGEASRLSSETQISSSVSNDEYDLSYPTLWTRFLRKLEPQSRD
jgi:hypothetical protein